MIIRLHFVHAGEPLAQRSVTSHSSRVFAAIHDGCAELALFDDGTSAWAKRVAVANVRPHHRLLDQIEALMALIDAARREAGSAGPQIAERHAALLAQVRELASSMGDAMVRATDAGLRQVERKTQDEIEAARAVIRRHPLRSIGIAAIASAILASIHDGGSAARAASRARKQARPLPRIAPEGLP